MYDDPSIISPLHVLIPAGIAFVVLAIAWNPWNRKASYASCGGPVAIAAAVAGVFQWIVGRPPQWMPTDAAGWIFHIAILMGILGIEDAILAPHMRWFWRLLIILVGALIAFTLVLRRPLMDPDQHFKAATMIAATAALVAVWWLALREPATDSQRTRTLAPIVLTLVGIAAALTQIGSHSVLYTRLTLAVAAATGAIGVAALFRKDHVSSPSVGVAAVLVVALLLAGHFFSDVTLPVFFAVAGSPVLILALRLCTNLQSRRPLLYQALAVVLLLVPLLIYVTPLIRAVLEAANNPSNPYGV
jgi:hypothetical protein